MFKLAILILAATTTVCVGSKYEDNQTNVGVYANHISSCNLNHYNGNMLCINRDYESVIQYHDVASATFCPYHYCVTFRTTPEKLACTGYVYVQMSGTMSDEINPLTPNKSNTHFTGNPDDDYINVGYMFEGFNVLIDRFEQSVETDMGLPIVDIQCEEPQTTCVSLADGTLSCFGGKGLVYHDFITSAILGIVVPGAMSFVCYMILENVKYKCAKNWCVTKLFTPILIEVCCMLILFVASDFIVKVLPFLLASLLGILFGNLTCELVVTCFIIWKRQLTGRVQSEYGSGSSSSGMLKNSNSDKQKQRHFEIGGADDDDDDNQDDSDDGMTEIELGQIKKI